MGLWHEITTLGVQDSRSIRGLCSQVDRRQSRSARAGCNTDASIRRDTQQTTISELIKLHPQIGKSIQLFEWFAGIIRRQQDENIKEWIGIAKGSSVPEIKGFSAKLLQDLNAMIAGVELPWSQRQTEGQVTRLKFIRRQMYGRGEFDLLRKQVLRPA